MDKYFLKKDCLVPTKTVTLCLKGFHMHALLSCGHFQFVTGHSPSGSKRLFVIGNSIFDDFCADKLRF